MTRILIPGRTCWAIEPVSRAGVLIDNRDYYRAFVHAALAARRFIYISGWQFDSDVRLLRGKDAASVSAPSRFLPFLNYLCEHNPKL